MNLNKSHNTEQLQAFLDASQAVAFSLPDDKSSRYVFNPNDNQVVSLPRFKEITERYMI